MPTLPTMPRKETGGAKPPAHHTRTPLLSRCWPSPSGPAATVGRHCRSALLISAAVEQYGWSPVGLTRTFFGQLPCYSNTNLSTRKLQNFCVIRRCHLDDDDSGGDGDSEGAGAGAGAGDGFSWGSASERMTMSRERKQRKRNKEDGDSSRRQMGPKTDDGAVLDLLAIALRRGEDSWSATPPWFLRLFCSVPPCSAATSPARRDSLSAPPPRVSILGGSGRWRGSVMAPRFCALRPVGPHFIKSLTTIAASHCVEASNRRRSNQGASAITGGGELYERPCVDVQRTLAEGSEVDGGNPRQHCTLHSGQPAARIRAARALPLRRVRSSGN